MLLGIVSSLRRLDRVLETVPEAIPGTEHAALPASPEDRATLHLILGAISLRDRLRGHLRPSSPEGCSPEVAAAPAVTGPERLHILR
jgi:hypothetical protein